MNLEKPFLSAEEARAQVLALLAERKRKLGNPEKGAKPLLKRFLTKEEAREQVLELLEEWKQKNIHV